MEVNHIEIQQIIAEAAATHILPRYESLKEHEIIAKSGKQDLVTIADIETEKALTGFLLNKYPGSIVIGEESVASGTADIADLSRSEGMIWVIDPVDGTYNFVNGSKDFAVMLACIIDGETRYGWIYDVMGNEFGFAAKGEGAWYKGRKAQVSEP